MSVKSEFYLILLSLTVIKAEEEKTVTTTEDLTALNPNNIPSAGNCQFYANPADIVF